MVRHTRNSGIVCVMGILTMLLTACAGEAPQMLDRRGTPGVPKQTAPQPQADAAAPVLPAATGNLPSAPAPVVVAPAPTPAPAPVATPEQNAELTRLLGERASLESKMQELIDKQAMLNQQMQVEQEAMSNNARRPAMNNNAAQSMARRLAQGLFDIAADFQRVVQAVQAGDIAGVIQGLQDLLTGVQTEIEKIQDQLAALEQLIDQINDLIQGQQSEV